MRSVVRTVVTTCSAMALAAQLGAQTAPTAHDAHRLHRDTKAYIAALEDPARDAWQKPQEVIQALGLTPGMVVADIGAGSGYFALRFARHVGAAGRVYAVDVDEEILAHLERGAASAGVTNVKAVLAPPDDPRLPDGSVDHAFICNVWHHVDDQTGYLRKLKQALRPSGHVVMVDFHKRELPVGPPLAAKIAREDLIAQMEANGFRLTAEHTFLPYQYFLVFSPAAPASSPAPAGTAAAADRPVYEVLRAPKPPVIDGRLDDDVWAKTPPVGAFVQNADGAPSPLVTEARMAYDDTFLYFAFRVEDENLWATMKERDDHLWTEEVVEVFIQPDPAHPAYVELEVNPLGTMIDIFLLDRRKPLPYTSWNSHRLLWAVQVDGTVDGKPGDRGWTCEIALPHEDLAMAPHIPPRAGDRWRLNLYRVEKRPATAALAWSPTRAPDFHLPDRFGEIVFSDRGAK